MEVSAHHSPSKRTTAGDFGPESERVFYTSLLVKLRNSEALMREVLRIGCRYVKPNHLYLPEKNLENVKIGLTHK